ncbi:tolA protein [Bdellovibrio reynosensis]|uniref:TolA protein n=1 Tax=Bdellovibrio reynosensis TaxID=2835041 RepID=A0ABY4C809_9BACT|nr:tolA protein [Bdellovibrio reynosensis]UOF01050.1 tolA protein [Bdellovibrio reynosensis]
MKFTKFADTAAMSFLVLALIFISPVIAFGSTDIELLYGKQIAWTAANIDDPKVVSAFRESFQNLLADKNKVAQLQTAEGKKLLQQGTNLLGVVQLKERLDKCVLKHASAKEAVTSLTGAMNSKVMDADICVVSVDETKKMQNFAKDLENSFKDDAKKKILDLATKQLGQTRSYWKKAQTEKDPLDLAVELTDREREMKSKPPQTGTELLLYTKALRDRRNKQVIRIADVKKAFTEVQSELQAHEDYLKDVSDENAEEALQKLIVTNPAAAAHYLMENPGSLDLICRTLQDYDKKAQNKDFVDKAMFWGGLVVGGVLLATGIGAGVGAMVLSGTATAGTLTTVAASAALAGTVAGGGEAIYSSTRAYESFNEARQLRASAFAEGSSQESFTKADKAKEAAYSDLADAGFSAASIIPFGAGLKVMKSSAQASRLGSASRVAKEGSKVEAESVKGLAVSLKEVSADKDVLKVLEHSQKQVDSEEMGMFLGYLSHLPKGEREKVMELIKKKPEKVPEAIRESSKAGVCR